MIKINMISNGWIVTEEAIDEDHIDVVTAFVCDNHTPGHSVKLCELGGWIELLWYLTSEMGPSLSKHDDWTIDISIRDQSGHLVEVGDGA